MLPILLNASVPFFLLDDCATVDTALTFAADDRENALANGSTEFELVADDEEVDDTAANTSNSSI